MALRQDDRGATRNPTASSSAAGEPSSSGGGFGSATVTIKGRPANSTQRRCLAGVLTAADEVGASRRVHMAVVMCVTQESEAGTLNVSVSGRHLGPFHQDADWGSPEQRRDAKQAARQFLIGTRVRSWKTVHGGVKNAPGDLGAAIDRIQISGNPAGFAQHESEAAKTVDAWQGSSGDGDDSSSSTTRAKRYVFARGEKGGEPESSWEASDRLVKEVRAWRWAAGNVFHAASDDELVAAPASAMIRGDEDFLLTAPQFEWGSGRPVTEVTLSVLADRWGIMPGACVVLAAELGPIAGRFVVRKVSGSRLDSPEATVTLARPTLLRPEPPHETVTTTSSDGGEESSSGTVSGTRPGWPTPPAKTTTVGPIHQTSGLAGYPAKDYMAPAGTPCVAPVDGRIRRKGGQAPSVATCPSGGPCGFNLYLAGENGKDYFLTHLGNVTVSEGDNVKQGEQIAEVGNGPPSWSSPHVHMGIRG